MAKNIKPPQGTTSADSESQFRAKRINSLSDQLYQIENRTTKQTQNIQKQIKETTKATDSLQKTSDSKDVQDSLPEINKTIGKLNYTIQVMADGMKKITLNTAEGTKNALSQYGKAISSDINLDKQNTVAMALSRTSPLFGYYAGKFMETDVFKNATSKMSENIKKGMGNVWSSVKGTTRGIADSISNAHIGRKGKVDYSEESEIAFGKVKPSVKSTKHSISKLARDLNVQKRLMKPALKSEEVSYSDLTLTKISNDIAELKERSGDIPKLREGGYVEKGGLAEIHPAEVVMPIEKILDRIDKNAGPEKENQSKIAAGISLMSKSFAQVETYVGDQKRERKGLVSDFVTAFKTAQDDESKTWQDRLLKAILELKVGLIGMTSRLRIAWQSMLLDHPVMRNILMFGQTLKTAFTGGLKFVFGARGGAASRLSKAQRTSNVFDKIVNVISLIYMDFLPKLNDLVKYSKESLEFQTGQEAQSFKEQTWTMFDKVKNYMQGERSGTLLKDKIIDGLVSNLDLDRGSVDSAMGGARNIFSREARAARRAAREGTPGHAIGGVMRETSEILAHRGEIILPVKKVFELISSFSKGVYEIVKSIEPIKLLKKALEEMTKSIKTVASNISRISVETFQKSKENAEEIFKRIQEWDPIEKTKEFGDKFIKKPIEGMKESITTTWTKELEKARETRREKISTRTRRVGEQVKDFTLDPTKGKMGKTIDKLFEFKMNYRLKKEDAFDLKMDKKRSKLTRKYERKSEGITKKFLGLFDKHVDKSEKLHNQKLRKVEKLSNRRTSNFEKRMGSISNLKERLEARRIKKRERMSETQDARIVNAQRKIFWKGHKDRTDIQHKTQKKIFKAQEKAAKGVIEYQKGITSNFQKGFNFIFNRQKAAEEKEAKKIKKQMKQQNKIAKKTEKSIRKADKIKRKLDKKRDKWQIKISKLRAKVESKQAKQGAKLQAKIDFITAKKKAKVEAKLAKAKFKAELPMMLKKAKLAKIQAKKDLASMKEKIKEEKLKAKEEKASLKDQMKKARQEEWKARKESLQERWKQLRELPKKMSEFTDATKRNWKSRMANMKEQLGKLSKISKAQYLVVDAFKSLGKRLKKMGSKIWGYIMMGVSALGALISPLLTSLSAILAPIGAFVMWLAKSAVGKLIGMGGKLGAAGVAGVAMAGVGAYKGVKKAEEWGTSKTAAGIGGALGGTKKGKAGILGGVAKGAALGAAAGSMIPVVGTAIGGVVGAIAGGIMGYVGGENIAKGMQYLGGKIKSLAKAVLNFITWPFRMIKKAISTALEFYRGKLESIPIIGRFFRKGNSEGAASEEEKNAARARRKESLLESRKAAVEKLAAAKKRAAERKKAIRGFFSGVKKKLGFAGDAPVSAKVPEKVKKSLASKVSAPITVLDKAQYEGREWILQSDGSLLVDGSPASKSQRSKYLSEQTKRLNERIESGKYGRNVVLRDKERKSAFESQIRDSANSLVMDKGKLSKTQAAEKLLEGKYAAGEFGKATGKMAGEMGKNNAAMVHSTNVLNNTSTILANTSSASGGGGGGNGGNQGGFSSGDRMAQQVLACDIS